MEETNSTQVNSFEQAMNGTAPIRQSDSGSTFSVNSKAESVLNVVANVLLVLGIIAGVVVLIGGAVAKDGDAMMMAMIAGPVMFVFSGLLPWACIKVVVNMSRNLHAIRAELHELKNR
jgi:urea transporter